MLSLRPGKQHANLTCGLCGFLMRDATQTQCGCRMCRECVPEEEQFCPTCKEAWNNWEEKIIPDKATNNILNKTWIPCPFEECTDFGPIEELSEHLGKCPFRQEECEICGETKPHYNSTHTHEKTDITNHDMEELVQIVMRNGIYEERERKNEESKMLQEQWMLERSRVKHWIKMDKISTKNLQGATIRKKRVELIQQTGIKASIEKWEITQMSSILENTPPEEFIMTEPFYLIPDGHRMCLKIYPNGTAHTGSRWLSATIMILQGRYNEEVSWPMDYEITITVESQKEDTQNRSKNLLNIDPGRKRPSGEQYQEIYPTRIMRTRELKKKKKFLDGDTMTIRLTIYKKTPIDDEEERSSLREVEYRWPSEKRFIANPAAAQMTLCQKLWELRDITRKNWELLGQSRWVMHSKPFLTWEKGYCFRLRIHPFGNSTGTGSHLSIGLAIEKGPFDEKLEWPFKGVWECALFDHQQDEVSTFKLWRMTAARKVKPDDEQYYEISRFISLTKLFNTESFWENNTLKILLTLWKSEETSKPPLNTEILEKQ